MKKNNETKRRKTSFFIFRLFFISLILFEALSGLKILNFSTYYSWLGLFITDLFLWLVAELLVYFDFENKNLAAIFGIIFIGTFLDASGDIFRWYMLKNYDKFLHFINSALAVYLAYIYLKSKIKNVSIYWVGIFSIGIISLLGAFYEIEEFLEDYFIRHGQLLRSGGNFDTASDILMNTLGSITIVLCLYIWEKLKDRFKI